MKKFLTLITILFSIFIGMQNINAQSVNIGYINSTYVISDSNAASQMTGNGMYGGFDYDYPVATNLLFNPGIFVDYVKYHLYGNLYGNVFYLRVPLHLKYSYRLDNMFELFGTAGPALLTLIWEMSTHLRAQSDQVLGAELFLEVTLSA